MLNSRAAAAMKVKRPDEVNNWLLRASLDCIKDETSLDINFSVCAPIPSTPNDSTLSDIWASTSAEAIPDCSADSQTAVDFSNCSDRAITTGLAAGTSGSASEQLPEIVEFKPPKVKKEPTAFSCKNCSEEFSTKTDLKEHVKSHKNKRKNDVYTCPICEKQLKVSSMWLHRRIHNESERFSCDICGQKFVQKINLIHHTKSHLGEKPFECSQCEMSFPERSHLLKHQRYHTATRQFKCEKCGKMYKTERCLKVHNLVHLEKRPFVCQECNKSFISSSKLKQHSNIHTGERPYKCKYCSRDFTNFPNWLKHIRRRHKVDHKTGEVLQNIPSYVASKSTKSAAAKNEKKRKAKEVIKTEVVKEIKSEFTDIHGMSLNSAEELVMEQALEMEESGYLLSSSSANRIIDFQTTLPKFECFSPIQASATLPELPPPSLATEFQYYMPSMSTESIDYTTKSHQKTLPSVETLFASSFQKASLLRYRPK